MAQDELIFALRSFLLFCPQSVCECGTVGRWVGHGSGDLALPHRLSPPPGLQCNASVDLIGTCWPRSPAGQLVVRPCPAYFYGVRYNTTSKRACGGQTIFWEVAQDGESLRLIGGRGNNNNNNDNTDIFCGPSHHLPKASSALQGTLLIGLILTIPLEDVICNSMMLII